VRRGNNKGQTEVEMELTTEQKKQVINERITQYTHVLYGHTTDARVARGAGLQDVEKIALDNAARIQKLLDGYEKELAGFKD